MERKFVRPETKRVIRAHYIIEGSEKKKQENQILNLGEKVSGNTLLRRELRLVADMPIMKITKNKGFLALAM